ncbi:MAG: hypothetical protein KJN95_10340 [Gammaproteobacteria bacterium]|nr:hypothetical protein [Gammaproteobacteria bacterium]
MRKAGYELLLCQDPANMCFHFQSGVWLDDFGAAVSKPFVVTDMGGERLCDVDRGLVVVD